MSSEHVFLIAAYFIHTSPSVDAFKGEKKKKEKASMFSVSDLIFRWLFFLLFFSSPCTAQHVF